MKSKDSKSALSKAEKKEVLEIVRRTEDKPEIKQVQYTGIATFPVPNILGVSVPLIIGTTASNLSIGASSFQRIGTQIFLKEIEWRNTMYVTSGNNGSTVRMIVYCDNEYSGTTSSLFSGNEPMFNLPGSAGQSINYTFNTDTCGRGRKFTILKDKIINTAVPGVVTSLVDSGFQTNKYKKVFKGNGVRILLAPTNVVGEAVAQNKQYYVFFIASNGAVTDNRISEANYSLKYTDS